MVMQIIHVIEQTFGNVEFMALGLLVGLPCIVYPLLFPSDADKQLPISKRYVVKVIFELDVAHTHSLYTTLSLVIGRTLPLTCPHFKPLTRSLI